MALNWVMLESDGSPVPLPGEAFVNIFFDTDVSVFVAAATPLRASGAMYASHQRLVFVNNADATSSNPASEQRSGLKSLSIPHVHILQSEFQQPWFSANYLSLLVQPAAEGGLTSRTVVEIRFNDQGLFPFVEMVDKLRARAIAQRREVREADTLPAYIAPENRQPESTSDPTPDPRLPRETLSTPDTDLPPAYAI